jgi:hypothetical protein
VTTDIQVINIEVKAFSFRIKKMHGCIKYVTVLHGTMDENLKNEKGQSR